MKEINQHILPEGWELVSFSEVCTSLESGKRPKGGVQGIESGVPSIGAEHLNDGGGFNFKKVKFVPEDFAKSMKRGLIKQNDIIIVKDGATTGKTSFVDISFPYSFAVINEHVFILRLSKRVLPKFAYFKLFSSAGNKEILQDFRGAAQGGISSMFVQKVTLPLPSLSVQQSIVSKIEELFSELDKGIETLRTAQQQLKTYRQSVLKWAFEGRLTEEWRNSVSGGTAGNRTLVQTMVAEDEGAYGNLPEGWDVLFLADVSEIKRGKSKHRPRNDARLYGGKYPFIQTGDIRNVPGKYISEFSQTYSELGFHQSKLWPKGTLCITIAANIGDVAILGFDACFPDSVVGILCDEKKVIKEYAFYFFKSFKQELEKLAPATAQKNINVDILERVKVPLPTLKEQTLIVREIESRLSVADKMDESIEVSLKQAEVLRQSILKMAFEGRMGIKNRN